MAFQFEINKKTYKIELINQNGHTTKEDIIANWEPFPKGHINALKALGASMDSETMKEDINDCKWIRKIQSDTKNVFGVMMMDVIISIISDGYVNGLATH